MRFCAMTNMVSETFIPLPDWHNWKSKKFFRQLYYACDVFIDLEKAFHTVNHRQIKLLRMRGITDNCFKSFLQDWYQYSNIKESSSERLLITNDVPQVSFRGPLLFLLHINALFSVSLFRWYKSPPYRKNI